jgi:hypothetical protein
MEPPLKTNGLSPRPVRGVAIDLGAMEAAQ